MFKSSVKENAQSRRRERRKAKQEAWKENNPMLVGKHPGLQPLMASDEALEQKPGYEPQCIKFVAQDIFWSAREYKGQIIRATYLYEYEFGRSKLIEGNICLPDVARYNAGYRKSKDIVTAR